MYTTLYQVRLYNKDKKLFKLKECYSLEQAAKFANDTITDDSPFKARLYKVKYQEIFKLNTPGEIELEL